MKNKSPIKIKKSKQGSFTAYAKSKGGMKKGGGISSQFILQAKHSDDPSIRKKAVFADNARKWHH